MYLILATVTPPYPPYPPHLYAAALRGSGQACCWERSRCGRVRMCTGPDWHSRDEVPLKRHRVRVQLYCVTKNVCCVLAYDEFLYLTPLV